MNEPTFLHPAPIEAYQKIADKTGRPVEDLYRLACETAEAINKVGGLEAAIASARPWAEVRKELGLE